MQRRFPKVSALGRRVVGSLGCADQWGLPVVLFLLTLSSAFSVPQMTGYYSLLKGAGKRAGALWLAWVGGVSLKAYLQWHPQHMSVYLGRQLI